MLFKANHVQDNKASFASLTQSFTIIFSINSFFFQTFRRKGNHTQKSEFQTLKAKMVAARSQRVIGFGMR